MTPCNRCGNTVFHWRYGFKTCVICARVTYSFETDDVNSPDAFRGTHYVLRYIGDSPVYENTVVHSRRENRASGRMEWRVDCPHCGLIMTPTSLSGKSIYRHHRTLFKCPTKHSIYIIHGGGILAWIDIRTKLRVVVPGATQIVKSFKEAVRV